MAHRAAIGTGRSQRGGGCCHAVRNPFFLFGWYATSAFWLVPILRAHLYRLQHDIVDCIHGRAIIEVRTSSRP